MLCLISDLVRLLNMSSKILIYGAGVYANKIYPYLKRAGLKDKIAAFIVTERQNDIEIIDGIPVQSIGDLELDEKESYSILIAVSKRYTLEIEQELRNMTFQRVLRLIDFEISDLNKISDKKFLDCIIDWSIWNHVNSLSDAENEKIKANEYVETRKKTVKNHNQIVFIVGNLSVRIVKIINAMVSNSYHIVLLRYGNIGSNLAINELSETNVECIECMSIEKLFYQAIQYNPIVYFFEPAWGDCSWAETMIRHESVFGKIVISLYDVLNDGYAFVSDSAKCIEKYVLENASGIVWRYYSKEYLETEKGFHYKGRSIQFLDYCKGYKLKREKVQENPLKLCCVTGDLHPFFCASKENEKYIREAQFVNVLKKIGNRADCIFHVFTGISSDENKRICSQLEKQYKNFKIIYGTRHDDLIKKISMYDYGCFLFDGEIDIPCSVTVDNKYYGSQYINAVSNRYFDYIDAGIPLIGTRPLKLCNFFNEYGIIVNMDLPNIDIDYLNENKRRYKTNVERVRNKFFVDNQIYRLIDFFEQL